MSVIKADKNNFSELVKDGLTLVDFYADWCGPCQMLSPILNQLSESQSKVKIIKLNVDEDTSVAQEYGVMSMPTMIVFKDGKKYDQKIGLMRKEDLEIWFNSL